MNDFFGLNPISSKNSFIDSVAEHYEGSLKDKDSKIIS